MELLTLGAKEYENDRLRGTLVGSLVRPPPLVKGLAVGNKEGTSEGLRVGSSEYK